MTRNDILKASHWVIDLLSRDSVDDANIIIALPHHEIHEGHAFYVYNLFTAGGSICFKTPTGERQPHLVLSWRAEAAAVVQFWEGASWDAETGAVKTIINRDFASSEISIVLEDRNQPVFTASNEVIITPDNLNTGSAIEKMYGISYAGGFFFAGGGEDRGTREVILKPDTTYVVQYTGTDDCLIILDWYEP